MQTQADLSHTKVIRPKSIESTALGAAYLAGLATGFWESIDEIKNKRQIDRCFSPMLEEKLREEKVNKWHRAVERALDWKA